MVICGDLLGQLDHGPDGTNLHLEMWLSYNMNNCRIRLRRTFWRSLISDCPASLCQIRHGWTSNNFFYIFLWHHDTNWWWLHDHLGVCHCSGTHYEGWYPLLRCTTGWEGRDVLTRCVERSLVHSQMRSNAFKCVQMRLWWWWWWWW